MRQGDAGERSLFSFFPGPYHVPSLVSHIATFPPGRAGMRRWDARMEQLRGRVLRASPLRSAPCAPLVHCARVDLSHHTRRAAHVSQHAPRPCTSNVECRTPSRGRARPTPTPTLRRSKKPKTPRDHHGVIDGDGLAGHGYDGHDTSTACLRGRRPHRPMRNPREQTPG